MPCRGSRQPAAPGQPSSRPQAHLPCLDFQAAIQARASATLGGTLLLPLAAAGMEVEEARGRSARAQRPEVEAAAKGRRRPETEAAADCSRGGCQHSVHAHPPLPSHPVTGSTHQERSWPGRPRCRPPRPPGCPETRPPPQPQSPRWPRRRRQSGPGCLLGQARGGRRRERGERRSEACGTATAGACRGRHSGPHGCHHLHCRTDPQPDAGASAGQGGSPRGEAAAAAEGPELLPKALGGGAALGTTGAGTGAGASAFTTGAGAGAGAGATVGLGATAVAAASRGTESEGKARQGVLVQRQGAGSQRVWLVAAAR